MLKTLKLVALSFLYVTSSLASFTLENLSLEEKVGQLFMVHFNGETANKDAEILIQDIGVGGIIYSRLCTNLERSAYVK
jgi:hypothetical protein